MISKGNKVMAEIRADDFYDPYGLAMGWLFAIAEVSYVEYGYLMTEFTPSPMLTEREDLEGYEHEMLLDMIDAGEIEQRDLEYPYEIMSRYADWCKLAGRSY